MTKEQENRCMFWLPKKKRFCANAPLHGSQFCGNHKPEDDQVRVPCPVDPSHSILQESVEAHVKRCPFAKQVQALEAQPFYKKGVNGGRDEVEETEGNLSEARVFFDKECSQSSCMSSSAKRDAMYKMDAAELSNLIEKIKTIHKAIASTVDSYSIPEACNKWLKQQGDRKLPFQEKHALQQASILGNMETIGILQKPVNFNDVSIEEKPSGTGSSGENTILPSVIEFGAGRGYLTHMLTDCYGIKKVFLVERKSYKLKADRTMRQEKGMSIERLRIDIKDLNLHALESLRRAPCLAVGKHLCGPATDLTLRCCLSYRCGQNEAKHQSVDCKLKGLAVAPCCHHLCQWKHYINKKFMSSLGISKEEFHAITWFTSWAVDAEHGPELSDALNLGSNLNEDEKIDLSIVTGAEGMMRNMKSLDRAVLGFICKEIIDVGRFLWIKDNGLEAQLVKYVPPNISPENHLLIAKCNHHF